MSSPRHFPPIDNSGGVGRSCPTATDFAPSALPDRNHLHRLHKVWVRDPIYFLTCCTAKRRPFLASSTTAEILKSAFHDAPKFHRWVVGRYVIMPDHVHFFARPFPDAKPLSDFIRDWKKWTARKLAQLGSAIAAPIWQPEFFDHVLRSPHSFSEKWDYVRNNPVRAGLVPTPEAWPWSGECEQLSF